MTTHPNGSTETTSAPGCPVRKLTRPDDAALPALELSTAGDEPRWVVRTFDVAREVLRASEGVRQAGFGGDRIHRAGPRMRPPILYLEGQEHHAQRRAAARLFAPKVTEDYRDMMEEVSERLVATIGTRRPVDLSRLSLLMAVHVAGRVIGLTSSSVRGMSRRLDAFFAGDSTEKVTDLGSLVRSLRRNSALARFHWFDVRPAIRAHRRRAAAGAPGPDDVISQLVEQGFSDLDILTECVTYGAAGMATTREFITVAVWHLLDDPALLARYRAAGRDERLAILDETLRLEPVVGHLYRRTTAPLTLAGPDGPVDLPEGTLIDVDIRAVNAEHAVVGDDPLGLCPGRDLPRGVPATLMSFGDGHHRCPGAPLAIMETEVFVTALLRRDVVADGPPNVRWNEVTQGYDLDRFRVRVRG
ncbi:cytochrome P450 [Cellulomonas cellasea]|uniref:Cytochrome P450 n=1 Tax=Cellulomonas cellasea TaxID=43670 RepID=A0A7W4YC27_9CELL|nr:cytochrome P450 [Cellulomonas cellasea]MBB2923694.1 cytochrome P450 [Cellulomonas cellasea]